MVISRAQAVREHRCGWMRGTRLVAGLLLMSGLWLSGCKSTTPVNEFANSKPTLLLESRLTDYRATSCTSIWLKPEYESRENPLYWLRTMDCAGTLSRAQIQMMVADITVKSWADALKRGVLLSAIDISIEQRQKMLNVLNEYNADIPSSLRPLLQLWRDQQIGLLALQKEQRKYRQLQSNADNKIDALKERESRLHYQLEEMSKKLAGLTDIERQLSSRKSGFRIQDSGVRGQETGDREQEKADAAPAIQQAAAESQHMGQKEDQKKEQQALKPESGQPQQHDESKGEQKTNDSHQ